VGVATAIRGDADAEGEGVALSGATKNSEPAPAARARRKIASGKTLFMNDGKRADCPGYYFRAAKNWQSES
jgi:hypothetical protein